MKVSKINDESRAKPWRLDATFGKKRVRKFFATEREAEKERDRLLAERDETGEEEDRLTPAERIEFAVLRDRLSECGATMEEAVDYYLAHAVFTEKPLRLQELLERAIERKDTEGKAPRYLNQLASSVGQLCRWNGLGGEWAHRVTGQEIEKWVEGNGWASKTRRNYLIDVRTVFEFGKEIGAVSLNPTDGIPLPDGNEGAIIVMTPMDAARLVARCLASGKGWFANENFGSLLPYVTLGCFAGLRPDNELGKLSIGDIALEEKAVVVSSSSAKSRKRRVVDLSDNAVALLEIGLPILIEHWESRRTRPEKVEDYRICPPNFKRRWEDLRQACGFQLGKHEPENGGRWWKGDIMRHSYASYHFAEHQNENLLKAQMGHTSRSEVLFQNYRLRVKRSEAAAFWAIGLGRGRK